ncbi:hypothetical protein ABZS66_12370 [Dactylosporangium sp. NPDC005572]|uniref:hypothetical protein n=1 Tax=Dactylosporangium sp. NPDC005572 TaxID=3156889 RepID=UPI0033A372FF
MPERVREGDAIPDLNEYSAGVVAYDLRALIARFDTRFTEPGEGAVVGALSSLVGESLLLDLLADALHAAGSTVRRLPGRPARDNNAFAFAGMYKPKVRFLDGWLVLDDAALTAVECKHWTSSSRSTGGWHYRTIGDDAASYALEQWNLLQKKHLRLEKWTDTNKIALPVRQPADWTGSMANLRRILAIWTPISSDGHSYFSSATTTSPIDGIYQDIPIEVFSGSLYARALLARGHHHLDATISGVHTRLDALGALLRG